MDSASLRQFNVGKASGSLMRITLPDESQNENALKAKGKRGPKRDLLKLEGNWKNAILRSFQEQKPKEGWPKPD
jgi:hypothetical protein